MFRRQAPQKGKAPIVGSDGLYPVYQADANGWYPLTAFTIQEQLSQGAVCAIYIKSTANNVTGWLYLNGTNGWTVPGSTGCQRYTPRFAGTTTTFGIQTFPPATKFIPKFDCDGGTTWMHLYEQVSGQALNHSFSDDIAVVLPIPLTDQNSWFRLDFGGSNQSPMGIISNAPSYLVWINGIDSCGGLICKSYPSPVYPNDQVILQIVQPSAVVVNYQNIIGAQQTVASWWGSSRLNEVACCSNGATSNDGPILGATKYLSINGQQVEINQFRQALCAQNSISAASPTNPSSQCDLYMQSKYCTGTALSIDPLCACFNANANMQSILNQIGGVALSVPISTNCLVNCAAAPSAYRMSIWNAISSTASACTSAV